MKILMKIKFRKIILIQKGLTKSERKERSESWDSRFHKENNPSLQINIKIKLIEFNWGFKDAKE